jgi:hypothetical protein
MPMIFKCLKWEEKEFRQFIEFSTYQCGGIVCEKSKEKSILYVMVVQNFKVISDQFKVCGQNLS